MYYEDHEIRTNMINYKIKTLGFIFADNIRN